MQQTQMFKDEDPAVQTPDDKKTLDAIALPKDFESKSVGDKVQLLTHRFGLMYMFQKDLMKENNALMAFIRENLPIAKQVNELESRIETLEGADSRLQASLELADADALLNQHDYEG